MPETFLCLKGLEVDQRVKLLSTVTTEKLGIAWELLSCQIWLPEVARGKWSETTVAFKASPADFSAGKKDIDRTVLKSKVFQTLLPC